MGAASFDNGTSDHLSVDVPSTWRVTVSSTSSSVQCEPPGTSESSTGTAGRTDGEAQTESVFSTRLTQEDIEMLAARLTDGSEPAADEGEVDLDAALVTGSDATHKRNPHSSRYGEIREFLSRAVPLLEPLVLRNATGAGSAERHEYFASAKLGAAAGVLSRMLGAPSTLDDSNYECPKCDTRGPCHCARERLRPLCMSWAPAGQSVAVGYGFPAHAAFCEHTSSCIAVWNVMRGAALAAVTTVQSQTAAGGGGGDGDGGSTTARGSKSKSSSKSASSGSKSGSSGSKAGKPSGKAGSGASASTPPTHVIEISACVTALAFHPSNPSLFAAGTFHGEVLLYSMERVSDSSTSVDPVVTRSVVAPTSHRDPLTQLVWYPDPAEPDGFSLASACAGGNVLVWNVASFEQPKLGFTLQAAPKSSSSAIPPSTEQKLDEARRSVTVGLTGLSFLVGPRARQPAFHYHSAHTPTLVPDFIATSESGAVLHCKQRAARGGREGGSTDAGLGQSAKSTYYPSPVLQALEPHEGPCLGVVGSPFEESVFATWGAEGTARVWAVRGATVRPVASLSPSEENDPVRCAAWSPSKPGVIALGTADGRLHVYDLLVSPSVPQLSLALTTRVPVRCLGFSPRYPEYIACGAASGEAAVFQLSPSLAEESGGEPGRFAKWVRARS